MQLQSIDTFGDVTQTGTTTGIYIPSLAVCAEKRLDDQINEEVRGA